jgi:hypothetical protein
MNDAEKLQQLYDLLGLPGGWSRSRTDLTLHEHALIEVGRLQTIARVSESQYDPLAHSRDP